MLDYEEMLAFVEKTLVDANAIKSHNPLHQFRSRFDHSRRVLGWCKRIETDLECDKEVLYTSAIFHDVGYCAGKNEHAHEGAVIFREYAAAHGFDAEFTEKVAGIIEKHSDKSLLPDKTIPNELVLLMEADLLDEEGALGFVWDFMAIGQIPGVTYYESLDACKHSTHILDQDFMVTPLARKYWEKKKELVRTFVEALNEDLFTGE